MLASPDACEQVSQWADANQDKLDKSYLRYSGQWYIDPVTCPDGSVAKFDGPFVVVKAVASKKLDVVKMLVQKGCRIDYRRENGNTALIDAVWECDLEMAKFILGCPQIEDKVAYVNLAGEDGETALFRACGNRSDYRCVEWLIQQGANIEYRSNAMGFSALHKAAMSYDGFQITALLNAGLSKDTCLKNPAGHTALHTAAEVGNLKTSATLISAGISPHQKDALGETPISIALARYPQVYTDVKTFGTHFKELADSMTSNPMR